MDDVTFFFGGWEAVGRVVLIGILGYSILLLLLRASGQRTLARMTPFDFVITVTLGSAFGRVLTATEVGLLEVAVTFLVLVSLQWAVTLLRSRIPAFSRLVRPEPALLYHEGRMLQRAMRRHGITAEDLVSIIRQNGMGSLDEAQAIVLEPDGLFSVLSPSQFGDGSALSWVTDHER